MQSPSWLNEAWKELGLAETSGPMANPRVLALFRDAHHPEVTSDETAWCAAFVGAALERANIKSTRSLLARSYLEWGEPATDASPGSIAIFARGSDPDAGHVGFVLAAFPDMIVLLGGNQNNAVTVERMTRANLLGLRWPSPTKPVEANADTLFDKALAHVLEMEGGFDDDPLDPGGPTNRGITLNEFATWRGEVLTSANRDALKAQLKAIDPATVRDIYRKRYWAIASCGDLPAPLAFMHFDAAVNHGTGGATRMLQDAVGTDVDGEIGPVTLNKARSCDPAKALTRYTDLRRARYRALPHFWRFGRGWLARVDITLARARALIPSSPSTKGDHDMTTETRAPTGKWWGQSLTIWGAVTTALSAIIPPLATAAGLDITSDQVADAGTHVVDLVQAATALLGTVATIYGRLRAQTPLERRSITLKI